MSLESGTYVADLNGANPSGTDPKSQGDDHIRLVKTVLKNSFAGFPGAVVVTGVEAQGATVNDYVVAISPAPAAYPVKAFASLGAADPTAALTRSLSGQVDNPYLSAMNQANINQSMQGYNDALDAGARALTRQALPAVRSGAMLAGQYGGSRQGIAEGLALSDYGTQAAQNARNLAQSAMDSGNQLYGAAYEGAQNRMAQTATSLAGLGMDAARGNADRELQVQSTNAANGLAGAQLNLSGGQAMGALGQYGLGVLGDLGGTQQALQAAYQRAPLDVLQQLNAMYGQLPLDLFNGSKTKNFSLSASAKIPGQ